MIRAARIQRESRRPTSSKLPSAFKALVHTAQSQGTGRVTMMKTTQMKILYEYYLKILYKTTDRKILNLLP